MQIINTYLDYKSIKNDKQQNLVAGTYHIAHLLKMDGKRFISPDELFGEAEKSVILKSVVSNVKFLDTFLSAIQIRSELKAILLVEYTRKLFHFFAKDIIANGMQTETEIISLDESDFVRTIDRYENFTDPLSNLIVSQSRFKDNYYLDFSSRSGRKDSHEKNVFYISPQRDKLFGVQNYLSNGFRLLTNRNNRIKIDIAPTNFNFESMTTSNPYLGAAFGTVIDDFYRHRNALVSFLKCVENKPYKAKFNNVGKTSLAGYASALSEFAIPREMFSHGAMVVHGNEMRKYISSILANCIYNYFPGIETVIPRSPLQVSPNASAVKKISTVKPLTMKTKTKKFTILYAPNFLPWHQCYHGLAPSCFETRKCTEAIAELCNNLTDFKLNIRLKTTVLDNAKLSHIDHNRGILPNDIEDLYNPKEGIFNVSLGSHSALLKEADLVVSEGVTAVLFEALENRIPLLLLNQNEHREASMPSKSYDEVIKEGERATVYRGNAKSKLKELLDFIKEKHHGYPLTDEELEPFVWI